MLRAKRRMFSGVVCEQIVYSVSERVADVGKSEPRLRFETEEERAAHRLGISRRRHVQIFNANFSPSSLYSTLTFDNEHEVHTFPEARRVRDLYVRRLKYHYPEARITVYMGRGKSTHRIHLHMVSEGIPEEDIIKYWQAGTVLRVEPLREHNYYNNKDYGQDYTGLANYLFDHWTPEQGHAHRWKGTKNLLKPDREKAKVVVTNYTLKRPPKAPEGYILVESMATKFGLLYFKYVLKPGPRGRKKRLPLNL